MSVLFFFFSHLACHMSVLFNHLVCQMTMLYFFKPSSLQGTIAFSSLVFTITCPKTGSVYFVNASNRLAVFVCLLLMSLILLMSIIVYRHSFLFLSANGILFPLKNRLPSHLTFLNFSAFCS